MIAFESDSHTVYLISLKTGKRSQKKSLNRPCQGGSHVARLNFKTSRVSVYIYCRLCRHCRNLAEGGCLVSRFHFMRCRYFLGHVACQNLPWQGLIEGLKREQTLLLILVLLVVNLLRTVYKLFYFLLQGMMTMSL